VPPAARELAAGPRTGVGDVEPVISSGWYGVRCVFEHAGDGGHTYEERVTLWRAGTFDEAIALAEAEAEEYAVQLGGITALGLLQAYVLADEPGQGAEVFSLLRDSELPPDRYLDTFSETGTEYQQPSA
jgi:hypothetical protein